MGVVLAIDSHAQNSQFTFDPNGNLLTESPATVAPPQILSQPVSQVVASGELASFFVVVADSRALTYQWRFNGMNISGATNEALLLANVAATNEGLYSVVLVNPSGSVTSAPAALLLDGDDDGLADSWETANFGNLTNYASSDFDGDQVSNLQEFLDGTNPADSASTLFRLTVASGSGLVSYIPAKLAYTNGESVTLTATAIAPELFHGWTGDLISWTNPVTLSMTGNKTVVADFQPKVLTWTNLASGSWHNPTNWNPNFVPLAVDDMILPNNVTVTVNGVAECRNLTLTAGTLTGNSNLTVYGAFTWTGGGMSGGGRTIVASGATLTINSTPFTLNLSRALENGGTVVWTGNAGIAMNNAVITNRAGALFHVQNAQPFTLAGGTPRFDNAGTFRKSGSSGTTIFNGAFNNYNTVDLQNGTLWCSGRSFVNHGVVTLAAGTTHRASAGGSASGTFNAPASALVDWTGGTFTLNAGAQLNGDGLYRINGAALTCNIETTVQNLNLLGGTLGGSGLVTVINAMTWTHGTMSGSGRTIIAPGATLTIHNPTFTLNLARPLENGGTVVWTGNAGIALNNSVITNRAGALFHVQNAQPLTHGGGTPRFDNAGTFRKSANTGTLTIASGVTFTNYGTVDIRSGIIAANGTYASSSNALLSCAIGGTTAGTGYGQLQKSGTITLNGALSVDFANGFSPALNDSFTVLTAGMRNGAFASFYFPSNAVTMQLSNSPNSVIVQVTEVLAVPPPTLLQPELLGPDIRLTWTAVSNMTYRLEFNPDLANLTNWNPVPGDVTATTNTASKLDPLTPSNRLYRVRVLP